MNNLSEDMFENSIPGVPFDPAAWEGIGQWEMGSKYLDWIEWLWAYVGSDTKSGAASFQIRHSKKRGTLRQSIDPLFHWTKRPVSTTPPRTPPVAPTNKMVETTRLILG
jgi:hypothetical protein